MFSHLASSCRYRANRGRQNQGCQQSLHTPSLYLQVPCIKSPFGNFGIHLASMCPWRHHYNFSVVALVLSAFLIPRPTQFPTSPPSASLLAPRGRDSREEARRRRFMLHFHKIHPFCPRSLATPARRVPPTSSRRDLSIVVISRADSDR